LSAFMREGLKTFFLLPRSSSFFQKNEPTQLLLDYA
jgi:hypothetical protein